jgi:cell volume regulation protein A
MNAELVDLVVPAHSAMIGRSLVELGLPRESLVVLIGRNEQYLVPSGGTVIEEGDTILALVDRENLADVKTLVETPEQPKSGRLFTR